MLGKKISDKLMSSLFNKSTADVVILMDADGWKDTKMLYAKLNVGKLHGRIKVVKLKDDYDIAEIHEDFRRKGVVDVMKNTFSLKESTL